MKNNIQQKEILSPALISCIIPVFNCEKYLAEALESVFAQTYSPLEVIVVDDGSTDDTCEIIAAFASWIKYFRQPNAGPAAARNQGIKLAKGRFLAFLDADDCWHPEKLSRQMEAFQANTELEVCVSHIQNFQSDELKGSTEDELASRHFRPFPGNVCPTLLAKKEVFEKTGLFDETLRTGEDLDWFLRAKDAGIVKEMLADVLLYRRLHKNNLTKRCANETRDNLMRHLKKLVDRHKQEKNSFE